MFGVLRRGFSLDWVGRYNFFVLVFLIFLECSKFSYLWLRERGTESRFKVIMNNVRFFRIGVSINFRFMGFKMESLGFGIERFLCKERCLWKVVFYFF